MQQMMRKMGIQQSDLNATQVIIRLADKELIFDHPSIAKVNMMGQVTFQLTGEYTEHSLSTAPEISDDDIQTVMEQASVNRDTAKSALEKSQGDLAKAIMSLQ